MKNILTLFFLLTISVSLFAQEKKAEMPQSGTLAATTNVPVGQATQDGPVGENSLDEATVNPLTASVARVSASEYKYTVNNNSEDQYSVNLTLVAKDVAGKVLRKSPAFVSLPAKKSVTRTMRVSSSTANVSVEMRNWSKKSKEPSSEEVLAEIEAKKKEIKELEQKLPKDDNQNPAS